MPADRHTRVTPDEPGAISPGGRYTLSRWPDNFSWDFVAVGRGHDIAFWRDFISALETIDLYMAVNIEHEDQELDQLQGLRFAAQTLREASGRPSRQEFADLTAAPHRFDDPIVIQGQRSTHLKYTVRR